MKIKKSFKQDFFWYAKRRIVLNRDIKTDQLIKQLKADEPDLFKQLAARKMDSVELANKLLAELSQEIGIVCRSEKWTLKKSTKFCRYCASPLNEVYLQGGKGKRFCNIDCYDDYFEIPQDELDLHEDPYWDDYLYLFDLFDYFKELYPYHWLKKKLADIKQMNTQDLAFFHLNLLEYLNQLKEVFEEEAFLDIEKLEGADGPVAQEMFRILKLLRREDTDLKKAEAIARKKRGTQKLYGIKVDGDKVTKSIQQKNEWITFNQRNKHHKVKHQFLWTTRDVFRRNEWYDQLTCIFKDPVGYENLVQCLICSKWEDPRYMTRQADQFHYCTECSEEHRIIFDKIT